MTPRRFAGWWAACLMLCAACGGSCGVVTRADEARPNILLAIADDWGYPHAGAYGDPVVKTPTFDQLARQGVLFRNAFVSAPSCTPSRGALLTGQYHWRLEEGANLHGTLPAKFRSYAEMLRDAGYEIAHMRKAWGPGRMEPGGRSEDPSGPVVKDLATFLARRDKQKPFCFWMGSPDPHRPYDYGSGAESGMDLAAIRVPAALPDCDVVRNDVADYYLEVQRFDREVGEALTLLAKEGLLDQTLVAMTGDHGMPFPRGKCNLYDLGVHVPLAVAWPARIPGGRVLDDLVSLTDLAPTFLAAAGLPPTSEMTGKSLAPRLWGGAAAPARDHLLVGKERHTLAQEKGNRGGYPSRALRNAEFLFVRNFAPERWPNGVPASEQAEMNNAYSDCDNGPSKQYLLEHASDPAVARFFALAFAKRPAVELYDLRTDPDELVNVADKAEYAEIVRQLDQRLMDELRTTGDPRATGGGQQFDEYPYYGKAQSPDGQRRRSRKAS